MAKIFLAAIFIVFISQAANAQQNNDLKDKIKLTIVPDQKFASDTFQIQIYKHWFPGSYPNQIQSGAENKNRNVFLFENITQPCYISISRGFSSKRNTPRIILSLYLAEPGDDLSITILPDLSQIEGSMLPKKYLFVFKGKGAAKYECRNRLDNNWNLITNFNHFMDTAWRSKQNYFGDLLAKSNEILDKYRGDLTTIAYNVLKLDHFIKTETYRLNLMHNSAGKDRDSTFISKNLSPDYWIKLRSYESKISLPTKLLSLYYPQFIIDRILFSSGGYLWGGSSPPRAKPWHIEKVYRKLKSQYSGELRDILISYLVLGQHQANFKQTEFILKDALQMVQTEYCLAVLNEYANSNMVGKEAYNFSLPDIRGNKVSLSDFKGKVVFIDFWFNGCGGCIDYHKEVLLETEKYFKEVDGVVFVSINVDSNIQKWINGVNSGNYTSPDIINVNTEGKGDDHPLVKRYHVKAYPRPLLIDKEGKIFSNNTEDLRAGGPVKLIETINKALQLN